MPPIIVLLGGVSLACSVILIMRSTMSPVAKLCTGIAVAGSLAMVIAAIMALEPTA